jgi:hypothetical protein
VRVKKAVLLGLAALAVFTVLWVAACGGGSGSTETTIDPKVVMQQALDPIEASMNDLMSGVTSGQANGADLKAAVQAAEPQWQAVVDACAGIGADATEAQNLWDAMSTAINALPDDAAMAQMLSIAGPGMALQTFIADLRSMVGPSAGSTETS